MKKLTDHPDGNQLVVVMQQMSRWDAMLAERGFGLYHFVRDFVDTLRSRSTQELSIDAYIAEVTAESAYLPRGFWNVDARAAIPLSCKSSYLDMLEARRQTGDSMYAAQGSAALYSLDPNECLYIGLKLENSQLWSKHLKAVSAQKSRDLHCWIEPIQELSVKGTDMTLPAFKAFLKAACRRYKLLYKELRRDGENVIYLYRKVGTELYCGVTWRDFTNLTRSGSSAIDLCFLAADDTGPFGAMLYGKRMGRLMPGGDWYMWQNKDWPMACFGFLFAINMVDIIAGACDLATGAPNQPNA